MGRPLAQFEIARKRSPHGRVRASGAALIVPAAERPARQTQYARETANYLQGQSAAPMVGQVSECLEGESLTRREQRRKEHMSTHPAQRPSGLFITLWAVTRISTRNRASNTPPTTWTFLSFSISSGLPTPSRYFPTGPICGSSP